MRRIVLFMIVIIMLIPVVVSCAPKNDKRTSDLGVSRSSLVSSDGWAYYSSTDGLFKIRPDGTDKTLVLHATPLTYSIYEERIYYVPFEKDDRKIIPIDEERCDYISIFSCNTDGSNNRLICETEFNRHAMKNIHMRVVDGWIYIGLLRDERSATGYDLYRMSIDSTEMTMITPWNEFFFDYSIDDDGWIYYLSGGEFEGKRGAQLWRMHHDGKHTQQVMQDVGYALDYTETEIFYIDMNENYYSGDIYAVSRDGSKKRKVVECEAESAYSFLKVIGDWVYFLDYSDNRGFYKVRKDGSELTEIPVETPPYYNRMAVTDNWLTYRGEDIKYFEMVRISDIYDTDELYDLIYEDQMESAIRNLDMDDPIDQRRAERYKEYQIRKYE